MKRWLRYVALLICTLGAVATATSYRALSLDEITARTDLGFLGSVVETTVEDRDGEPFTRVTFEVTEALKGDLGERVTLAFYGGTLPNGRSVTVLGMPQFEAGESVVILAYDAPYYSPIVGFSQGLWRVNPQGLIDENGQQLSLSPSGELLRSGDGGERPALLAALAEKLEATP